MERKAVETSICINFHSNEEKRIIEMGGGPREVGGKGLEING